MSAAAIAAIVVFGLLFITWVILPSQLRKRHAKKLGSEAEAED